MLLFLIDLRESPFSGKRTGTFPKRVCSPPSCTMRTWINFRARNRIAAATWAPRHAARC